MCVSLGLISFRAVWVQRQAEESREKPGRLCAVWLQPPAKEHLVVSVWLLCFPPLASALPPEPSTGRSQACLQDLNYKPKLILKDLISLVMWFSLN